VTPVLVLSFILFVHNNDFALGLHIDEPAKVYPVIEGWSRFNHPQLLMILLEFARWITGENDPQGLVEIGRFIAAAFGVLLVYFSFLLARRAYGTPEGLMAAVLVAAVPLVSVHAHYLKEDIFMAPFFVGGLWTYLRHRENPTAAGPWILGVFLGLAASGKLVGALLPVVLFAAILADAPGRRLRLARDLALACAAGAAVFLLVNVPALLEPLRAAVELGAEIEHGLTGHVLRIGPGETYFTFHFLNSLVPGLTGPVAILLLAGMLSGLLPGAKFRHEEIVILLGFLVFYLAHEISPTKPPPDSMRYMVPVAPLAVILALRGLRAIAGKLGSAGRPAFRLALAIVVLVAAIESVRLTQHLDDDTRLRIPAFTVRHMAERHTYPARLRDWPDNRLPVGFVGAQSWESILDRDVRYLVLSSFAYRRFSSARNLKRQDPGIREIAARYEQLLACPATSIEPEYRSFAFSNPTIRIIDVRQCDRAMRARSRNPER
jgi:hypothetical protein